ncbi:hypothetical protein ACFWN7_15825 [Agromyces sp. NPDC058484]|uniref:hypothetical protein n=1 Tax=Agromyces sp. NPDC058484 TaxID=3346524 RepID=UPI00365723B6
MTSKGPKPDGQVRDLIEVMLGTATRIGETLALRKCDVVVSIRMAVAPGFALTVDAAAVLGWEPAYSHRSTMHW